MHRNNFKKILMIRPLLFQAQEVVQELLDASKLKKEKKKKKKSPVRLSFEDLDPRNVRPGETRNQSTAWYESLLYAFDARFPNLSFF